MTENKNGFKLVGIKLKDKTTNENNQAGIDCGTMWQKFENEKIFDLIPDKLSNEIYAVYYDYEGDETKPYAYFIGCKVTENSATPTGLESLSIPSQNYTKLTAKGVMTGCIIDTWKQIWNSDLNRKFGFDFEVYDERSQDWSNAEVDIFLSTTK